MGAHQFKVEVFLEITLLFFAICMNVTTSSAQPGFLSIDCGSTRAPYSDKIGLNWVGDGSYARTGINSNSQGNVFSNATDNRQALQDFRYFPEPRNKHCYELPTISNTSYLIRAMFYYFESEELRLPIQFNVFINATNWFTVTYDDDMSTPLNVQEGIFYSPGSVMYFCLQPLNGSVPFISSLELRPLDAEGIMYSYNGNTKQYLSSLIRYNIGAAPAAPTVRFPDDNFDRLWYTLDEKWNRDNFIPSINVTEPPDTTTSADRNNVPPKVMLDAYTISYNSFPFTSLSFTFSSTPVAYVYTALYFEELNVSDSGGRGMTVSLNGANGRSFNVTNRASIQKYANLILQEQWIDFEFGPPPDSNSTSGVIVNALEVYAQYNFDFSMTNPYDGETIRILQQSLNLTDWQGDPCTPVPYNGLTCTNPSTQLLIVDECIATGVEACVEAGFAPSTTFSISTLTLSNLTSSGFTLLNHSITTGPYYPDLNALTEMSITYSEVNTSTFQILLNTFQDSYHLTKLDLSYNAINALPPAADWSQIFPNLAHLILSHNVMDGELPSFFNMSFVNSLQELDLSYNAMTSFPTKWGNITGLTTLDLSHNNLAGDISSLDKLVRKSSASLHILNVSDNSLTGPFSGSLYFSRLRNLTLANFDRNHIEGMLNLSAWYESLKEADSNANASRVNQLFSFVDNNISDITPSAEVFQITIDSLLEKSSDFNKTGVLLGGNPYCKRAKSHTQQYLCRFTVEDKIPNNALSTIWDKESEFEIPCEMPGMYKSRKWLSLTLGIIGGMLAFLLFCILIAIIWKLWKKVKVLQEIEKALADQQVQPRFYSYNDLKSATKSFHVNNKLGQGGFGVVYKGELPDGTGLGVKKLFPSAQQAEVLNEFLNEVVLITGIKHKNLVQLKGCCIEEKQRILVYEYVENGNLAEALWGSKAHGCLNWEQCWDVCVGVARGLSYLHEELQPCIIHRDIKPANILLDKNFRPKIADFGLARPFLDGLSQALYTQIAGTLGYFSPEYATQGQLTEKADVYSYGIVVLEVVSGRKCIDNSLPIERVFLKDWAFKMHGKGTLLDILQPQLRDKCVEAEVIRAINVGLLCVQTDPQKRPTMSQVVTMLLGSMDLTLFFDKPDNSHPDFKSFLAITGKDTQSSSLQSLSVIEEEFEELPLLNTNSQSSSRTNSGNPSIELMSVIGR